jgi:hypothetical protein
MLPTCTRLGKVLLLLSCPWLHIVRSVGTFVSTEWTPAEMLSAQLQSVHLSYCSRADATPPKCDWWGNCEQTKEKEKPSATCNALGYMAQGGTFTQLSIDDAQRVQSSTDTWGGWASNFVDIATSVAKIGYKAVLWHNGSAFNGHSYLRGLVSFAALLLCSGNVLGVLFLLLAAVAGCVEITSTGWCVMAVVVTFQRDLPAIAASWLEHLDSVTTQKVDKKILLTWQRKCP